ncbi:MAG: hypothetical protein AB7O57_12455 [Hyphomicrobiaceae bacterium]
MAERMAILRVRLAACREAANAAGSNDADALASAIAGHLDGLRAAELPAAAQLVWIERVARPLKADPAKPLPARAIAAIRSSPSGRIAQLAAALAEIEHLVRAEEIDAANEVIYAEISRTYS